MAYINLSQDTKLARLQVLNDAIGANATIVVYDGIYPQSPDYPPSANTLVSFFCDPTNFANVSTVTMVANTILNTVSNVATLVSNPFAPQFCVANGIAAWARISDMTGNAVVDLDVGMSNASIVMNSTDLIIGIPVQVVSIIITEQ